MPLKDATYYLQRLGGASQYPPEQGARWIIELALTLEAARPEPLETLHAQVPEDGDDYAGDYRSPAFVNRGRWTTICPCGGAQLVCRTDLRVFCLHCGNVGFDGKWLAVAMPDDAEAIEELLLARLYDQNRNWALGETLDDLRLEDSQHDRLTGQLLEPDEVAG